MASEAPKERPAAQDPKVVPIPAAGGAAKSAPAGAAKPAAAPAIPATFAPLQQPAASNQPGNLNLLLDVPLRVSVRLGSAKMVIRDLLQLGQGSIVELEKMAGEPMDVLVGEKLVARGEVVVVNERFGVRLTDIVSPTERIQQLPKN
jgi:flagellar motor switch protein FliN/FliY